MTGIAKIQPRDLRITRGPSVSFSDATRAGAAIEREVMWTEDRAREAEALKPLDGFVRQITSGDNSISDALVDRLYEQDFNPDDKLLDDVISEAEALGYEIPVEVQPERLRERREKIMGRAAGRVEAAEEVLGRADGVTGFLGGLTGSLAVGMTDPVNLATLPIGAPVRAGLMTTIAIEAGLNAAIEAGQTPGRNVTREKLGLEAESILENAAFGALMGGGFAGVIKGGQVGFRQMERVGRLVRDRKAVAKFVEDADPEAAPIAQRVLRDIEDQEAATSGKDPAEDSEHSDRAQVAAVAAHTGENPDIPDRPTFAKAKASRLSSEIEQVDPRELLVQPKVFQFKSEAEGEGGVTPKLRDVGEWVDERSGVVIVYEYADGSRAIVDGHQRTALAKRMMGQGQEDIRLLARVVKEEDGFTVDDVRVRAALKNIAEAADGLTAEMAKDAARVLRISPDAIRQLPAGPGIARAKALSRLSDEAFDLYINEVIPERFAEIIGRAVDDPALHSAMVRLLNQTRPETTAQAESIVQQALVAPVDREVTSDLFGETEVATSLYLERAKVLERAMKIMRDDRSIFRTLDDRADRIEGAGKNRLDLSANRDRRRQTERALAAIKALAYREGPISGALNNGAKDYKETGRLKDAAEKVADAVRAEIERNGLSGAGGRGAGAADGPAQAGGKAPSQVSMFDDPVDGDGVRAQVANTAIETGDDMPDELPLSAGLDADGNEIYRLASRDEVIADLQADDDAVAALDACVKG